MQIKHGNYTVCYTETKLCVLKPVRGNSNAYNLQITFNTTAKSNQITVFIFVDYFASDFGCLHLV